VNAFFKGTLLLIVVAFFSECVEFFVNMILARELQEQGMGIYMSIMPIIFLVFIIASLELPISISKFIAENKKELHHNLLQHAIKLAIIVMMLIIFIFTIFVISFPQVLNDFHPYVKWLLLSLIPIASFSSIARGYFMGVQHMGKIAFSNFIRKGFQFGMLLLIFHYFHFDQATSFLIALCALIGSEFVVFLYLFSLFIIHMRTMRKAPSSIMSGKIARQKLLAVSMPTVGLRIFNAITNAINPLLIHTALMTAGFGAVLATEQFGILMGVAMSIGFFPAFIAHSLMVMLIPNVSDAYVRHDYEKLKNLLQQSMWLTMIYGMVAIFCMHVFAKPLTSLFFSSPDAVLYLKLLWPYFFFYFFIIPMQAFLIGLGLVKDAFIHTVWSHIISFALMYFLGSQPSLNMVGIILGMNTGCVLLALMHYFTICKKIGFTIWLTKQRQNVY
jgi:stage V sporulation protein B